jgi:hypothetical protein
MPRKYKKIWDAIKQVKVGQEVPVRVHKTAAKTLRQAVLKEKSMETAPKKQLGMRYAGKLEIREEPVPNTDTVIVYFKLSWDGTRL